MILISCVGVNIKKEQNNIVFNAFEQKIVFNSENEMLLNDKWIVPKDCSTLSRLCLNYIDIHLIIELPRDCKRLDTSWFPNDNDAWEYLGGEGHDARGYYKQKKSNLFHFVYSPRQGVQVIEILENGINREFYREGPIKFLPCNYKNQGFVSSVQSTLPDK